MGLVLGTNLKFYTSVAKELKVKARKFWGIIPTLVEVSGEKLIARGGAFWPPSWIGFILVYHPQHCLMLSFISHLTSTAKAKTSLKLRPVPPWTKLRPLEIRVSKKYRNSENIPNNLFGVWCFCQKFSFHWRPKSAAWRNKRTCLQKD